MAVTGQSLLVIFEILYILAIIFSFVLLVAFLLIIFKTQKRRKELFDKINKELDFIIQNSKKMSKDLDAIIQNQGKKQ